MKNLRLSYPTKDSKILKEKPIERNLFPLFFYN